LRRPRNRAARFREEARVEDEARRNLEQAEREGTDEIETVTVDPYAGTPEQQRLSDEHETFASLPPGLDSRELGEYLWLTDEQGRTLPVSPEVYARYKRAQLRKPKRPRLDREIEAAALNRIDDLRDWKRSYDETDDWQKRARLRSKKPGPYGEPGQSFEEAAANKLHRHRDYEIGEFRRRTVEEQETEKQLARVRAERIVEQEQETGLTPTRVPTWSRERAG
jgi:hypothetical protein